MPQLQVKTQQKGKLKAKEAWESPLSHATTLLCLFVDTYGMEGLEWHPTTIKQQVAQDFGVELPRQNFDRLIVAITLVTTNYFYKRLSVFNDICNVLSGDDFDPGVFKPADVADCAWGITEAMLISPPDEPEPFADEIRYYIGALLKNEGFLKPPDVLGIALGHDGINQVQQDYSLDADNDDGLFTAIWQTQASKADEITQMIRSTLENVLAQLDTLPLQSGSTEGLKERLRQDIRPVSNG